MTRGIPSRPVFAALLAFALLMGVSLPAAAAPNQEVGTDSSAAITQSLAAVDVADAHFGFSRVLGQASPSPSPGALTVPNTATANQACVNGCTFTGGITGSCVPAGNGTFTCTASATAPTGAGAGQNPAIGQQLANGTTFTANCTNTIGAVAAGGTVTCNYTLPSFPASNGGVALAWTNLLGGTTQATGTAVCTGNPATVISTTQGAITATTASGTTGVPCATALGGIGGIGGFGGNNPFINNPLGPLGGPGFNPPGFGNPGIGGIGGIGGFGATQQGVCQTTGTIVGTTTPNGTGGATTTETITIPAGVPAGTAVFTTFTTTAGVEGFSCGTTVAGSTTISCTETTAGIPLQGSTKTAFFGTTATTATATVTGPGAAVNVLPPFPLLPPPPLEFVPPPPPPLLPPPPPAPMMAGAAPAMPSVPVIPEADSIILLIGGLAALGGLVAYRRRRS